MAEEELGARDEFGHVVDNEDVESASAALSSSSAVSSLRVSLDRRRSIKALAGREVEAGHGRHDGRALRSRRFGGRDVASTICDRPALPTHE